MSDKHYNVLLTPKARRDLESIYRYISFELSNQPAAESLAGKFEKAFDLLSEFPFRCPVCQTEPDYRKLVVDNYIAFYKVESGVDRVIIYRVLYGMMDYDKYL